MKTTVITHVVVTATDAVIPITNTDIPNGNSKVSIQVKGDSILTGAVTVQLREGNVVSDGANYKDVAAGVKVVPVGNSDEYIDAGDFNGAFLELDISVGTSTGGTITVTLMYK